MAEKKGSSIYDVARTAGLSIATVSRYLNEPGRVSPEAAAKIQAAMNELAYFPQGNAGSRDSRRIGRVGVLTPFFPAPSFIQRLQGMTPVLRRANMEMVVYAVDSPAQLDEYLHSIPFYKRLDGLIIMSMRISEKDSQRLLKSGLQVVMIEQNHPAFPCVECDNVEGGALAASHFLARGYESCGFLGEEVSPPYSLHPSELRWQGYSAALEKAGRRPRPEHAMLGELTVEGGERMARAMLAGPGRPRAIFAMSDLQAIGALRAARALGLRIPQDLAVLGFDDIDAASYMDLSTVSQALGESGRLAAELLLGRLEAPERPFASIKLAVSIVERSTT